MNPLNYGIYIGYLLIIWIVLKSDFLKKNLDFDFLFLFVFSTCYALFYCFNPVAGLQYAAVYMFTPPFLYLIGKYLAQKSTSTDQLFYVLISIGLVLSIAPLISVLLDLMTGGFLQANRSIPMFWGGEPKNATGMAAPLVLNMCIPAILLASYKKMGKIFKILLIAVFILSLLCVLRLGSRTQLVIVLFTFLIALATLVPKQSLKQNVMLFSMLAIGVYLVFRNVSFDLDSDWATSFAGRMENNGAQDIASGGGRTDRWVKSLENFYKKPFGWDVDDFGFSHNLWFDVMRVGGSLTFVLLVSHSIRSYLLVKKAIKANSKAIAMNMLLFTYFIAFMLLFMVEPIVDGSFYLFVLFCAYLGIVNKYRSREENSSVQRN